MKAEEWFTVVGIGIEGVEMLISTQDQKEAATHRVYANLRARFNSHRRIKVYCYSSDEEVTLKHFKNKKYLAKVEKTKEG